MSKFNCEDVESRLQDFVGGVHSPAEERRMREHLAACENCRREERELRRLQTLVAELPRSVEPPRDLWPGMVARLAERPAEPPAPQRDDDVRSAPWSRRRRQQWVWQAAAAVVFMVAGAGLSRALWPPPAPVADDAPQTERTAPGEVRPAASQVPDLEAIESEYLRAKESLWLLVYSHRDELSAVKLDIVQRNLVIIDAAIRDLREALADDPGNRLLENRLLAEHRRSIDLLQRLTEV